MGNRLSRNDSVLGLTTYDYDANDRLTQMLSAGVTTQFTYDDNGSMLSRSSGGETVTYDWINDGENRLVGVNSTDASGNQSVNYVYDAQGNRVASIGDGVRTNYLVTPGGLSQVLAEYDSNGLVTRDYTYGLGLVRSVEGGSESFYHTDGLGSVRMLTDTTGRVSDRNSYDAYGMSLSNSEGSYQFAGERRDAETGLDYLRARYYDPELGRFISKDAFAGFLNDPMSQHDYQYAHANPVNNTDPTGYFTLQDASTTVAFAGILASLSGSLGYVGGSYLTGNGPSGEELLNMADQWVAGFAHFASFGISTNIRSNLYGETATQNHSGFLWNMGNLAGAGMSLLMGAKVPDSLSFKMGRSEWLATIYEGISWGTSAWETGSNIREGRLEWTDAFNLLPFVSYGMSSKGVKAFLGTVREIDGQLRDWGKMTVVAEMQRRARLNRLGWTSETGAIVFRGTDFYSELNIFSDTGNGWILSEAARNRYMENGRNLEDALKFSEAEHQRWLDIWGNENDFVQAHGAFGQDLPREFGLDRTLISTSTDRTIVDRFGGTIFQADVPDDMLIRQTLPGAGESEFLIRHGSNLFRQL